MGALGPRAQHEVPLCVHGHHRHAPCEHRLHGTALGGKEFDARELRNLLGLSDAKSFRQRYLRKAIDAGLVEMTIPDKPRSRNQRYRLTALGMRANETLG